MTGFVVAKGNVDALVDAIGRLLDDDALRAKMGAAGRERAVRLFDWDVTARQFDEVYSSVRNGPHG